MGRAHQPFLDRIVVHVVNLLDALFFRENVEGDIAPLPEAMIRIAVDGGGESEPGQHRAAPGLMLIPGEGGDNLLGGSLLQFRHEADDFRGGFGSDEKVKVVGH